MILNNFNSYRIKMNFLRSVDFFLLSLLLFFCNSSGLPVFQTTKQTPVCGWLQHVRWRVRIMQLFQLSSFAGCSGRKRLYMYNMYIKHVLNASYRTEIVWLVHFYFEFVQSESSQDFVWVLHIFRLCMCGFAIEKSVTNLYLKRSRYLF